MTTEQVSTLKTTLETMFARIEQQENVIEQLEQIGKLQQEIAPTAPAMLNHYLERRSYTKALDFLKQGYVIEDPNRPDCSH